MKLAIFDFDGTLCSKETLPYLMKIWDDLGYSRRRQIYVYLIIVKVLLIYKLKLDKLMDKEKFRSVCTEKFLRLFQGMTEEEIDEFFQKSSELIKEKLYPKVVEEVQKAKEQGYHTVLLSGCFTSLLEYVGKTLNMDTIIGTELNFNEELLIDYGMSMCVNSGNNKEESLKRHFKDSKINWEESCAYGDSYFDYNILNLVGKPITVNPDERLQTIANERGWEILRVTSNTVLS